MKSDAATPRPAEQSTALPTGRPVRRVQRVDDEPITPARPPLHGYGEPAKFNPRIRQPRFDLVNHQHVCVRPVLLRFVDNLGGNRLAICLTTRHGMAVMNTTLTIRLPAGQRRALSSKAAAAGKTESEIVRDLIERELAEQTVGERVGELFGCLSLSHGTKRKDSWRKSIRARNWRR
jgi:hypothetical protein